MVDRPQTRTLLEDAATLGRRVLLTLANLAAFYALFEIHKLLEVAFALVVPDGWTYSTKIVEGFFWVAFGLIYLKLAIGIILAFSVKTLSTSSWTQELIELRDEVIGAVIRVEALLIITIAHYELITRILDSQPMFERILFFSFLFVYVRLTIETVAVFYPFLKRASSLWS